MLLHEVFKTVAPFSWTENNPDLHQAQFIIGNNFYEVNFHRYVGEKISIIQPNIAWVVEFKLLNTPTSDTDKFGVTGTGNTGAVFGTVIEIIKQFIQRINPKAIKFEAKEPSRRKLYKSMIAKLQTTIPGMKVRMKDHSGKTGESTVFDLIFKGGK